MTLNELRAAIDGVDAKLLVLLNERAKYVTQVGAIKRENQAEVCVPNREQSLLTRLIQLNEGPLPELLVRELFQDIVDTMKKLQQ